LQAFKNIFLRFFTFLTYNLIVFTSMIRTHRRTHTTNR